MAVKDPRTASPCLCLCMQRYSVVPLHPQAAAAASAGAGLSSAVAPGVAPQGGLAPVRNFRRVDEVHKAPHIMRPVGNGASRVLRPAELRLMSISACVMSRSVPSALAGQHCAGTAVRRLE